MRTAKLQDVIEEILVMPDPLSRRPFTLILGIAQDAGYPQAGCAGPCCAPAWNHPERRRHAACLAIVDPRAGRRWMIDATPDFKTQLRMLDEGTGGGAKPPLDGVFLTHAHAGHYPGLIHLGPEAMGARAVPLHAMPRMAAFLADNQPWADLIEGGAVTLHPLAEGIPVALADDLNVTPFRVPHRDERSETVGFLVEGPRRSLAYLPDIDGWEDWDAGDFALPIRGEAPEATERAGRLETLLATVDFALVDGTFYDAAELPGRDLSRIPHPRVVETMARLAPLSPSLRARLRFTHLNHSNPLLRPGSLARGLVAEAGFRLAEEGRRMRL